MLPKSLCSFDDYVGYAHYLKKHYRYVIAILAHDTASDECRSIWLFDQPNDTVSSATAHVKARIDPANTRLVLIEVRQSSEHRPTQIPTPLPDAS